MTTELARAPSRATTPEPPTRAAPGWLLVSFGVLMVGWYSSRFHGLGPNSLNADLGIQHYLARITSEGAVPLVDFEHGWNTASWYWNALLYQLAGGNPAVWTFLWGVAGGILLTGLLLLVVAWRLGLETPWVLLLVPAWMLVTAIPHTKYATTMAWLLVVLPAGVARRDGVALALRVGLPATVFWFHVELAILLAAGSALFDLFGDDLRPWRERLTRVAAIGAGLAAGVGSQLAVYATLDLPPSEVVSQVLFGQTGTYDLHFGYLLGNPQSFKVLVYPATLVLPFVPMLWRRLSEPTRMVAFLHLSQALIPIRRPGDGHVSATTALLVLLLVLAARDVVRSERPAFSGQWPVALGTGLVGAAWFTAAILAGFRVSSLLAIVALTLVCLTGVVASWRVEWPWAGVGAVACAGLLVLGGLGGRVVQGVRGDEGERQAVAIAEQLRGPLERCLTPARSAWVVPSPLTLYDTLDVTNPTPYYLFWYTFEAELGEVTRLVDAGEIPTIIAPYGWPASMEPIVDELESHYEVCAQVDVAETDNSVTVWTDRRLGLAD